MLAANRKQTQAELIRELVLREIEQDKTGLRPSAEMCGTNAKEAYVYLARLERLTS